MADFKYVYDSEKSRRLKETRGISFEDIIQAVREGYLLKVVPHHNLSKYPDQSIMIIEINSYAYLVPFIEEQNHLILKTIYPSRKATIVYLDNRRENE